MFLPPPAKVTLSEPVGSGSPRKQTPIPLNQGLNQVAEEDEDTSNDQFYSAAEDRYKTDTAFEEESDYVTETETELESNTDNDSLSDDSMEDMISLQAPMLPAHNASGISTIQPGSPQTIVPGGRRTNGCRYSRICIFLFSRRLLVLVDKVDDCSKTQGLARPLYDEMLHPKPNADDDEEARIFVDINSLTKIGYQLPLPNERTLQNALFAGLKRHFAGRTRIVRKGDLIAVPIDEGLGRTLHQSSAAAEDLEIDDDILSNTTLNDAEMSKSIKTTGVAWYRISYVGSTKDNPEDSEEDDDIWGGVASIDASNTRMMQSGSENSRLPAAMDNSWEYYLGLKSISKNDLEFTAIPEVKRPHVTTLQRRLRELIAAATSPRAIHLKLPPLAILLVSTQRHIGKATLAAKACADIGLHTFKLDAQDIVSEGGAGSDVKTAGFFGGAG
ncbi:hypothetical protein EYC84_005370 [Monilinia fructicola]|uniref:Peroxisomal ATPase PEX6 fourth domain-containing protein n=1 Tax=Monilinia fructicola TaxID=38448 RepID=A0A5M9JW93_MONFR|nr:hypothetical protein EYC84_005370 [Monilinia fructicola]